MGDFKTDRVHWRIRVIALAVMAFVVYASGPEPAQARTECGEDVISCHATAEACVAAADDGACLVFEQPECPGNKVCRPAAYHEDGCSPSNPYSVVCIPDDPL